MLPDESRCEAERNDRRNDRHGARIQHFKAEDDEQEFCYEENAECDSVGNGWHSGDAFDAKGYLVCSEQPSNEEQDSVKQSHFREWRKV